MVWHKTTNGSIVNLTLAQYLYIDSYEGSYTVLAVYPNDFPEDLGVAVEVFTTKEDAQEFLDVMYHKLRLNELYHFKGVEIVDTDNDNN